MPAVAPARPGCRTDGEPTPLAPAFHDRGRSCPHGWNPAGAADLLKVSPGCGGCSRLRRALDISAGIVAADKPVRRVKARVRHVAKGAPNADGNDADGIPV